jgi:adenosylcobinamide-phosphate synthase
MSIFIVYLSLLLDQLKPTSHHAAIQRMLAAGMRVVEYRFNAGREHHAKVIWLLTVLVPALLLALLHHMLMAISTVLTFLLSVGVLYALVGLRAYNQSLSKVLEPFEKGHEPESRQQLAAWLQVDVAQLPRGVTSVQINEQAVITSHQQVLGVVFWFIFSALLGLGVAGAVFYVLAWHHLNSHRTPDSNHIHITQVYWEWIDYVPARITAMGYAVMGNFEEAVAAWRRARSLWNLTSSDILLATASGATGAQLGHQPVQTSEMESLDIPANVSQSAADEKTEIQHLRSVSALIWRSMALWLVILSFIILIATLTRLTRAVFG